MSCIFFKKKKTKTILPVTSENPMTVQEKIAENKKYICDSYLMLHNIDYETLDNWECPICFRNIYDKNDAIFFPFICDHITCYSCFNAHCKYLRNTQKINDLTNYMKCSLCRSRVNKEWKKAKRVSSHLSKHGFYIMFPKFFH